MNRPPGRWVETDLGKLSRKIQYGYTASSSPLEGGPQYLRITDIQNDRVDWESVPRVKPAGNQEEYVLNIGDIVFARSGATVGKSYLIQEDPSGAIFASYLIRVVSNEAILAPTFASHFFHSPLYWAQINEGAAGTGQPNFNGTKLARLKIPLPPLAEQRRIVTKLDALTVRTAHARADLDRIPALTARYKAGILAAAFRGELTADWRAAKRESAPRLCKLADITAVPIRNGLSVRGSDSPPGVRALRLSALRSGLANLDDVRYLPITEREANRFELCEGDVLVSRGNGTKAFVGIAALVPNVEHQTIFPDTAFRIRLARAAANPKWFTHIWNAPQVRVQVEQAAKTTAGIWKVSQGDLAKVELLLPAPNEQVEIVDRLQTAFTEIDRLAAESAAARRLLDRLDQAILAKAFRGDLVPQDPADEPASALLERVKAERAAAPAAGRGRKPKVE